MGNSSVTDRPPNAGYSGVPDRNALIASAQAHRDRARMAAAQSRIAALQHRVAELERSPSRRALAPLRRALHTVAPVLGWLARVGRPVAGQHAAPFQAPVPPRGLALVIDNEWPQPDRDSGSIDICNLAKALVELGFQTILAAAKQHDGEQPARDRLIAQGIPCLLPADAASVQDFMRQNGVGIDLCVLCRVYCGGEFLELAQEACPSARIVFNSIDLNYLREERKAAFLNDATLTAVLGQVKAREQHVIRSSDATLVVSQAELDLLADTMPDCLAVLTPLARSVHPPATPFAGRRGIGFIGGFAHAPNVDALRFFLSDIWPLVQRQLPECELTVVGENPPLELLAGHSGVRMLGHVPDVGPWFEGLRLSVAPLRFGAGAKGKVASSLAAGVPCIATPVASEGMALTEASGVLTADTPDAFASALVRAYGDEALWTRLSAGAVDYAAATLSLGPWRERLDATLRRLGL